DMKGAPARLSTSSRAASAAAVLTLRPATKVRRVEPTKTAASAAAKYSLLRRPDGSKTRREPPNIKKIGKTKVTVAGTPSEIPNTSTHIATNNQTSRRLERPAEAMRTSPILTDVIIGPFPGP